MIAPRLVMILASAGSGKTHALTNRFIALLARGAAPERIVALTFTRKAAGEFFDGILGKLAEAAGDEAKARDLARAIARPELGARDFLGHLRTMIDALHRLRLGTLDSFFAQVTQAFPLELGLAGDFEMIEGHAVERERERALQQLFARSGSLGAAQEAFLEAFKQATFGTEDKRLADRMDRFLKEKYETFLEVPEPGQWGDAARIWPRGQAWRDEPPLATVVAGLRRWVAAAALTDPQRERWGLLATELDSWTAGAPWGAQMEYFLGKLLAAGPELAAGGAEIVVARKKQAIDAAGGKVLAEVVRAVAGGEVRRQLEVTRGVHAVLAHFDRVYAELVRRAGKLTFGDVTRLLQPEAGTRSLSFAGGGEGRLLLEYRLDARIDHWLLDEFQDTSRGQWAVLRNLIDEVVQDTGERRTFFCVGDVKQSIYAWRDGDPTLMRDIRRHYNGGADGPIVTQPLDASWRSGPPIIAMLNAVFGAGIVLEALFPAAAVSRWKDEWRAHTTRRPERDGQAALLFAADAAERARQTLEVIQEIDPIGRGLTCAVLTRSNDQAAALADFLRREGGVPAVAESDLRVGTDNPQGAALLALVQAAAHPGDSFAWEHVQMTPLRAALAAAGLVTREEVTAHVLGQISEEGFERMAERWIARLPAGDAFTQERARQFAAAAARFDATGRRNPDEFVRFMSDYVVREPESASVVRVMTIHKAKGLGFDVVILPELQGQKLDRAPRGLSVHRGEGHVAEWVLELPRKEVAEADPVLQAHMEAAAADACYEALSLLYVAMTRAKRALYAVVERPKDSNNYPKLLVEALGGVERPVRVGTRNFPGCWSEGNAGWFRAVGATPSAPAERELGLVEAAPVARHTARRPSGEQAKRFGAAPLFQVRERAAADFGVAVHRLLAEVEWCSPAEVANWVAAWNEHGEDAAVIGQVAEVLRAPGLAALWQRPGQAAGVWRERTFEMIWDEMWVTGTMDRVVIERNFPAGPAVRATVYDFKTDRVEGMEIDQAVLAYDDQMRLYRQAVARLTGLPVAKVQAMLVFTRVLQLAEAGV